MEVFMVDKSVVRDLFDLQSADSVQYLPHAFDGAS